MTPWRAASAGKRQKVELAQKVTRAIVRRTSVVATDDSWSSTSRARGLTAVIRSASRRLSAPQRSDATVHCALLPREQRFSGGERMRMTAASGGIARS